MEPYGLKKLQMQLKFAKQFFKRISYNIIEDENVESASTSTDASPKIPRLLTKTTLYYIKVPPGSPEVVLNAATVINLLMLENRNPSSTIAAILSMFSQFDSKIADKIKSSIEKDGYVAYGVPTPSLGSLMKTVKFSSEETADAIAGRLFGVQTFKDTNAFFNIHASEHQRYDCLKSLRFSFGYSVAAWGLVSSLIFHQLETNEKAVEWIHKTWFDFLKTVNIPSDSYGLTFEMMPSTSTAQSIYSDMKEKPHIRKSLFSEIFERCYTEDVYSRTAQTVCGLARNMGMKHIALISSHILLSHPYAICYPYFKLEFQFFMQFMFVVKRKVGNPEYVPYLKILLDDDPVMMDCLDPFNFPNLTTLAWIIGRKAVPALWNYKGAEGLVSPPILEVLTGVAQECDDIQEMVASGDAEAVELANGAAKVFRPVRRMALRLAESGNHVD